MHSEDGGPSIACGGSLVPKTGAPCAFAIGVDTYERLGRWGRIALSRSCPLWLWVRNSSQPAQAATRIRRYCATVAPFRSTSITESIRLCWSWRWGLPGFTVSVIGVRDAEDDGCGVRRVGSKEDWERDWDGGVGRRWKWGGTGGMTGEGCHGQPLSPVVPECIGPRLAGTHLSFEGCGMCGAYRGSVGLGRVEDGWRMLAT